MTQQPVVDNSPQDPNDWDHHWDAYGEAAEGNPANVYRRQLMLRLLGRPAAGSTVLDIGSGQGEFAVHLQRTYPDVAVWGVEYSAEGVARSQAVAAKEGVAAKFRQVDLLQPVDLPDGPPPAAYAVCSEVLEHVDDPTLLIRNARALLAPGCRVVITVPGGPRSAFDHHIGHFQHFTAAKLHGVLTDAGYTVERVLRTGFPFFNLYKLAVIARGRKLIEDVERREPGSRTVPGERAMKAFFDFGFRHSMDNFPLGWQMAAVATVPPDAAS
ncbi:class I SAM-dependent methyltransferase [Dactylosporangium roseum]|uniref:Class I SAM-dependent methyltransferase n=1 Tax=Dactylosporangium roseum TaxID=47989 RepID=A0ABY5ZGJ4_9ACTN|nr:class I SAM-dependent methyltransferase [Dactylosporangium roseum]UWZ39828.1 class I SAM-dependent methyltransferase [Dactylosporangium roseum]